MSALLEIERLRVALTNGTALVEDVSLTVAAGETVGLVGESGSGKSMTAHAVLGLFPGRGIAVAGGRILLEGTDLAGMSATARRDVRGRRIGMVFQDPSSYLDPLVTAGRHIAEAFRAHGVADRIGQRVTAALESVDLPASVATRCAHELSGGQRQRVLLAAALALDPALLIADEPTTALDVSVQAGILDLLRRAAQARGVGVLLITHDLGVVAETCDRVAVMYAGRIVEQAPVRALFRAPQHPYTQGLLASVLDPGRGVGEIFAMPGGVPLAAAMPTGCRFHPRCPLAQADPCATRVPPLADGVACWRANAAAAGAWVAA
jgi:oligopeptide/dipeptide ABC transporter ATP-binding protein